MSEGVFASNESAFSRGWFGHLYELAQWLDANSCCEYLGSDVKEILAVSHFLTPEMELAALAIAKNLLDRLSDDPPKQLPEGKMKEYTALHRGSTR